MKWKLLNAYIKNCTPDFNLI